MDNGQTFYDQKSDRKPLEQPTKEDKPVSAGMDPTWSRLG